MSYKSDIKEQPESEFNSAIASLKRIDEILQLCNYFSGRARQGSYDDMITWHSKLWVLYNEIGSYIDDEQKKKAKKYLRMPEKIGNIFENKHTREGILRVKNRMKYGQGLASLTKTEELLRSYAAENRMLIIMKRDESGLDTEW